MGTRSGDDIGTGPAQSSGLEGPIGQVLRRDLGRLRSAAGSSRPRNPDADPRGEKAERTSIRSEDVVHRREQGQRNAGDKPPEQCTKDQDLPQGPLPLEKSEQEAEKRTADRSDASQGSGEIDRAFAWINTRRIDNADNDRQRRSERAPDRHPGECQPDERLGAVESRQWVTSCDWSGHAHCLSGHVLHRLC